MKWWGHEWSFHILDSWYFNIIFNIFIFIYVYVWNPHFRWINLPQLSCTHQFPQPSPGRSRFARPFRTVPREIALAMWIQPKKMELKDGFVYTPSDGHQIIWISLDKLMIDPKPDFQTKARCCKASCTSTSAVHTKTSSRHRRNDWGIHRGSNAFCKCGLKAAVSFLAFWSSLKSIAKVRA